MSPYTTRIFTRRKAKEMLHAVVDDPAISDEILGDMLDGLLRPQLYNALVVPDYTKQNDDDEIEDTGS
jgi:hypothetical protein